MPPETHEEYTARNWAMLTGVRLMHVVLLRVSPVGKDDAP